MATDPMYDREAHLAIIEGIGAGMSHAGAAKRAGVPPSKLARWLKSGETGSGPYVTLWREVARIESDIEYDIARAEVAEAVNGGKDAQKARHFLLKHRLGWSERKEITGADGGPVETVTVDLARFRDSELRDQLRATAYDEE